MYQGATTGSRLAAVAIIAIALGGAGWYVHEQMPGLVTEVGQADAGEVLADAASAEKAADPVEDSDPDILLPPPDPKEVAAEVYDSDRLDYTIEYITPYAKDVVYNFNIKCPQPGKTLRLVDLLRIIARMGFRDEHGYVHTVVDSRGDEVRIYHRFWSADGRDTTPFRLALEVNKWDELRYYSTQYGAVMRQCYYL